MAHTKHGVAAWLLVVGALAMVAACLIRDTTGAHLELAPVFVGVGPGGAHRPDVPAPVTGRRLLIPTIVRCPRSPRRSASWPCRATCASTCGC